MQNQKLIRQYGCKEYSSKNTLHRSGHRVPGGDSLGTHNPYSQLGFISGKSTI